MNYNTLPEGYSLLRAIDLNTDKLKLWLNLTSLPVFVALLIPAGFAVPPRTQVPFVFDAIYASLGKGFAIAMVYLALWLICGIAFVPLHEFVHGLCFKYIAGGKPTYGQKLPFFLYAACENRYICKKHYFVITLAPLVVFMALLAPVCALVPQSWFWIPYFALVLNASGAVGDMYIAFLLLRMPKDVLAIDSGVAMQFFSKQGAVQ